MKRNNKRLKAAKRIIHEEYIDKYAERGMSKSRIYKEISFRLGYEFHCADMTHDTDFDYVVSVVKSVIEDLHVEYMRNY